MAKDDVLKFSTHDIGLACYGGVTNAWLQYAGMVSELCDTEAGRDKLPTDINRVPGSLAGFYQAFESPLEMKWRSRDGTELRHTVDLKKEIPVPRIKYDHPERVFDKEPFQGVPTVVVEYDDRTVNVYFAATLQVRPLDPATRPSVEHVDVFTLVYSRTL